HDVKGGCRRTGTCLTSFLSGLKNLLAMLAVVIATTAASFCQAAQRPVHNVNFKDLAGVSHGLFEPKGHASVYFFIAHDCPVANSYIPEMNRIATKYGRSGVAFFAVYTEKDVGKDTIAKHYKEYGFG